MILLGSLLSAPAAMSGVYALNSVASTGVSQADAGGTWHQLAAASPLVKNAAAWHVMIRHLWLEGIASGIVLLVSTVWLGCSNRLRANLHLLFVLSMLAGVGVMGWGAWFAGEGVYRHAIGVFDQTHPPERASGMDFYIDAEQLHVTGAGFAIALALTMVGLAFRAMVVARTPEGFTGIAAALGAHAHEPWIDGPAAPVPATPAELSQRVPSARFALLSALAALLTAAGGWWVLARDGSSSPLAFHDLWMWIRDSTQNNGFWLTRRLAHVICGGAIIVASLFIAVITRFLPRSRILLALFTCILLAALAGQVWLGVVLLNDSNVGPVTHFNAN
jgi:hypothetical protein